MKPYLVQYNIEQYIPEYKQLIKDNIFTQQQIAQISQQREKFERSIQETFTPKLDDAIQYCEHLAACRKLINQKYQQNQIQQPQQFSYHKQYMRIAKYIINANKYNLTAYCYFLQFAQKIKDYGLLTQVAQSLKQYHNYYYLSYVFLAYDALRINGINDCRRHFNDGDKQIRKYQLNYIEYNQNVKFTTQCIGEVDQIIQSLKDVAVFYVNWYHIESEYRKQILGDELEEIEEQSEQEDEQIKLYQNSFYESYVFCRLMNKICQYENISQDNIQNILDSEIMKEFISMIGQQLSQKIIQCGIKQFMAEKNIQIDNNKQYNIKILNINIQINQDYDNYISKYQNE